MTVLAPVGLPGCSAGYGEGWTDAGPPTSPALEIECERELLYLDTLIETRGADRRVGADALAEAVELRRVAGELFMDGEFELALELIEEAVALLEGSG